MFDIGFSELLLVAVVALIVLGPETFAESIPYLGSLIRSWPKILAIIARRNESKA